MRIRKWLESRSVPEAPELDGEFHPDFYRFGRERLVTVTRKLPSGDDDHVTVTHLTWRQRRAIKNDPKVAFAMPEEENREGDPKAIRRVRRVDVGELVNEERVPGAALSELLRAHQVRGDRDDLDRAKQILEEKDAPAELKHRILEAVSRFGLSPEVRVDLETWGRYKRRDDPTPGDAAASREPARDPSAPSEGRSPSEPPRPEEWMVYPADAAGGRSPLLRGEPAEQRGAVERVDSPDDEPGAAALEPSDPRVEPADWRVELPDFEPPDPAAEPAEWHVEPRDVEPPDIDPPDIELADNF